MYQGRLRLVIRMNFFSERAVTHGNRLPKEALEPPSLELYKACGQSPKGNGLVVGLGR